MKSNFVALISALSHPLAQIQFQPGGTITQPQSCDLQDAYTKHPAIMDVQKDGLNVCTGNYLFGALRRGPPFHGSRSYREIKTQNESFVETGGGYRPRIKKSFI